MIDFYFYLFIAGLVGGFIAGLAGVGTGFLLVAIIPLALMHFEIPPEEIVRLTIANSMFSTLCSSFMSNLTSLRSKLFYPKESFWVAGVATIVASILLKVVVLEVHFPKIIYNLVIIALLVYVVTRSLIKLATVGHVKEQVTHFKLVSTGLVGGLIAGFTGLAGGSIVIPMLNLWLKINIKKAKAITFTTIFFIALLLTIINLSHRPTLPLPIAHIGYIILPIAIPLALGVMVASPVGVLLGQKVSDKTISLAFITVILLVLVRKSIELINW